MRMRISIHALLAESDVSLDTEIFADVLISIHALLAESDIAKSNQSQVLAISIHALLAESDFCGFGQSQTGQPISIHALLAESDMIHPRSCNAKLNFYPRSPCGERQADSVSKWTAT